MKKTSILNLTFNILSILISMGLSFWVTPFMINSLGAESYGFIPLTQQLINYMTVITVSITAMSGRFFTIAKKRGDLSEAQSYFSTTLTAGLLGSAILTVPLIICCVYIDKILNIPTYLVGDVRLAFLIYGAIFLLTFLTACFNVGAFANNKLYVTSSIGIANITIRTSIIVALLTMLTPRIWYISMGNLVAAIVVLFVTAFVFIRLEPHINIKKLDTSKLKEILKSGLWISLSEIGVILFLQIDLFVANRNIGAALAGEYSVVLQLPTILRTFSSSIISIFTPTVISLYAVNKMDDMIAYLNNAVKYTGLVLALPIGLVCGLGGVLLSIWINPDYMKYQFILSILTIHLSVNLSVQTVMSVQTAMNRVKIPAFVTLIMGAINFILAYVLSGPMKMGALGIAMAGSLVLTSKNLIFSPIYAAYITGQNWFTYLKGVIKPLFTTILVAAISYFVQSTFTIDTFLKLFIACCIVGIIYVTFVFLFLINKSEKQALYSKIATVRIKVLGR